MHRLRLDGRVAPLCFLAFSPYVGAARAAAGEDIHVAAAEAHPTAPGAQTGVVYLIIVNQGTAEETLTSVSTPVAESASVHRTTNDHGVMRMDPVPSLAIQSNGSVSLSPDGLPHYA